MQNQLIWCRDERHAKSLPVCADTESCSFVNAQRIKKGSYRRCTGMFFRTLFRSKQDIGTSSYCTFSKTGHAT